MGRLKKNKIENVNRIIKKSNSLAVTNQIILKETKPIFL
jgi:hypothetical protein